MNYEEDYEEDYEEYYEEDYEEDYEQYMDEYIKTHRCCGNCANLYGLGSDDEEYGYCENNDSRCHFKDCCDDYL